MLIGIAVGGLLMYDLLNWREILTLLLYRIENAPLFRLRISSWHEPLHTTYLLFQRPPD